MAKSWDFNQLAQKWATSMGSPQAQQNYKNGIMALTQSPCALAATPDAEAKYMAGIQRAVTSGKRQKALQAVSLAQFQQLAVQTGAPHLGTGATAAQAKWANKMQPFAAVYSQIQSQLQNMPKGGYANAVARSQIAIQALMQAAGTA
jgi:hypothetical protein